MNWALYSERWSRVAAAAGFLGLTVVVIEHDMRVVKGVSDRVIACDYGQKIAEGTYEEVANDERVIEAYLGTKAAG